MFYAPLLNRGLIKISGDDKLEFMQGIVSNDMRLVASDSLVYACFLTPQGKYLADFFVFKMEDDWLIDIDKSLLSDLIRRMSMYKLRSKVELEDVSEQYKVYAFWGKGKTTLPVIDDPRTEAMGKRGYFPVDFSISLGDYSKEDYDLWRLQNGLPDVKDFERERSSMAEANMDLLNAISWDKGCYMGQELTARVHYRGLVKKRLVPLKTTDEITTVHDAPIKIKDKTIGHLRSFHKNHALALVQLDSIDNVTDVTINGQDAEIVLPEWFKQA